MRKKKAEVEAEEKKKEIGTLFIISTPIGNDDDITHRAVRALSQADIVICEEHKIGARILKRHNITKDIDSLNEQNEAEKTGELMAMLIEGKKLALISDCGTPVFADPGLNLVQRAIEKNINIIVVPGASSIMTALVRSGFSIEKFVYAGFLDRDKEKRYSQLKELREERCTVAVLEAPYRIMPVLEAASRLMPDRNAYIGCNLTMPFESHHYGNFKDLFERFEKLDFKGEFVIVFEGDQFKRGKKKFFEERKFDDRYKPATD
ncbi:MAG: 16S rRNA (cytidine(1402)-2'-O)-methyltransferase, partial [FCB group bacterium]